MNNNFIKKAINNCLTYEDCISLIDMELEDLEFIAKSVFDSTCSKDFDLCTIINGKSIRCSENCKFCGQSASYNLDFNEHRLLSKEEFLKEAKYNANKGVLRFSIVTSGRKLNSMEIDEVCEAYKYIAQNCDIKLCASHGLLSFEEFCKLKESGVTRIHNNLETSRNYFTKICTSHTYDEKIEAIKNAQKAGIEVCSGGIIGLGESYLDRVLMALELKELGIKSIPINVLTPIPGTPLGEKDILDEDEILKSFYIFRIILGDACIRTAGGRNLMADKGRKLFEVVANGAITGDMLTTAGVSIKHDINLIHELGFKIGDSDER
ncbi:MAG: biotin synthase BioB [Anaerovoracaceae bacterium]